MTAERNIIRDSRASTAIEFALASPVLLMMILGGFEVSKAMQVKAALREAVGAAGRAAMVSYQDTSDGVMTDTQVSDFVRTTATNPGHRLKTARLTVSSTITNNATLDAKQITVTASYAYPINLPYLAARTLTLQQTRIFYAPD